MANSIQLTDIYHKIEEAEREQRGSKEEARRKQRGSKEETERKQKGSRKETERKQRGNKEEAERKQRRENLICIEHTTLGDKFKLTTFLK